MIFVFGGAYQGKRDFVKENLGIKEEDILNVPNLCDYIDIKNDQDLYYSLEEIINTSGKTASCVYGLETFIRVALLSGRPVDKWLEDWLSVPAGDKRIIIMNDMSQGLVPMDAEDREYREACGRAMIKLSKAAEEVYRVFCGLGQRIK